MAKKISDVWYRTETITRAAMDKEKRMMEMSFSSEHPVEREFGNEILDHGDGCCDLSRLSDGGAMLLNHDPDRQIGVVEEARIENKRGMAKVRFGESDLAKEIYHDVETGIRRLVSVGYRLMDMDKVEMTEEEDGTECYRFRSWQPFEVSIVPIPADPTVGVGRNDIKPLELELPTMNRNILLDPSPPTTGGGGAPIATVESPELVAKRVREATVEILKTAKNFQNRVPDIGQRAQDAIEKGMSTDEFNRILLDVMKNSPVPNGDAPLPNGTNTSNQDDGQRTVGELFTRSQIYKDFASRKSTKASVEIPGTLPQHMTRATLTSSGLTAINKIPGVVLVEQQALRVADLFSQGTTSSTTIRFTKEDSFTNAATAVAEEGQKPEATFALSESDVTIQKIAVLGRVTDESLQDYEYMQSYVNSRLLWMVAALEDNHLLNGTAASNQIRGILNVSGIQTQAHTSGTVADSIHKAITKVRSTGFYEPDGIILHPTDWQNIVLQKDSNGQYYAGGPFTGPYGVGGISRATLWGLPVVVTTALGQGTGIVGAHRIGATIFRRSGVTIETTNSDASDFQYNRIAIRAEERLALVTYRPTAFCTVTGIPLA